MSRLFISYTRSDAEQCQRLVQWLQALGFEKVFVDSGVENGIAPGADWERTLYTEIAQCDAVIILVTANWFASKWCFAEFIQARSLGKLIVPVIDTPSSEALIASDIQHVDLVRDRDAGLARLETALRALLPSKIGLPLPTQSVALDDVYARPPGAKQSTVQGVTLRLQAGQSLGVFGPNGSGKSSLAHVVANEWQPSRGNVKFDNAAFPQWRREVLRQQIGFAPQIATFQDGSIAQNIARFDPNPDSQAVILAAQEAGVHNLILSLPNGYETKIDAKAIALSFGERQRIALARALYGSPFLVVADSVDTALDQEGVFGLQGIVKSVCKRGGVVVLTSQRTTIFSVVDLLLVLNSKGNLVMIGPTSEVVAKLTQGRMLPPDRPTK